MLKDLLTRDYLLLFLLTFVVVLFVSGFLKGLLVSAIVTFVKFLYDRYLANKINPLLDKLLEWIKSKIKK